MICINLTAQPGAGKSTLAAATFAKLKMLGINCELVTEFAKDKVWENNKMALSNQILSNNIIIAGYDEIGVYIQKEIYKKISKNIFNVGG